MIQYQIQLLKEQEKNKSTRQSGGKNYSICIELLILQKIFSKWWNQEGKIVLIDSQFAWCPALNEISEELQQS